MLDRYRRIQREVQDEKGKGRESGFTLIELLIVIVVLGILAAVTVFGLNSVTGKSLTAACRADAKSVGVAQEAFRAQNTSPNFAGGTAELVSKGYLRSDPGIAPAPGINPSANASHYLVTTDSSGVVMVKDVNAGKSDNFDSNPAICDGIS